MARQLTESDLQADMDAMIELAIQLAETKGFILTAAYLATAQDSFRSERDSNCASQPDMIRRAMHLNQELFTLEELTGSAAPIS